MIDVTRRGGIQEESMDVDTRPCLDKNEGQLTNAILQDGLEIVEFMWTGANLGLLAVSTTR